MQVDAPNYDASPPQEALEAEAVREPGQVCEKSFRAEGIEELICIRRPPGALPPSAFTEGPCNGKSST